MDSTLRSNVPVGLPLDMLVYGTESLAVTHFVTIDAQNQYFNHLRNSWDAQLKTVFEGIAAPVWDAAPEATANVLSFNNMAGKPMWAHMPSGVTASSLLEPLQSAV